jgi:hypothetical protein
MTDRVETLQSDVYGSPIYYYAAGRDGWCGPLRDTREAAHRDLELNRRSLAATKDERR